MKMTLLEMTQAILSSLDSDEVNSISDTTESLQVANIIKMSYLEIVDKANLPEKFTLFNLIASGDNTKPCVMYVPDTIDNILWLKYNSTSLVNVDPNFLPVTYRSPEEFFELMPFNRDGDVDVGSMLVGSVRYWYNNNRGPSYWTSFDDRTIVFDAFDINVDTTLQSSKTMAYGETASTFLLEDSFIPQLDSKQFTLLYNEAKATAFAELKQTAHPRAERKVKVGWNNLQRQKGDAPDAYPFLRTLPNYGRK